MPDAVTDTHGLIWYLQDSPKLGKEASRVFDACDNNQAVIYIPMICMVEIIYLQEKKRIPQNLRAQLQNELSGANFVFVDLNVYVVEALEHIPREQVPDMPDRIIAATAWYLNLPLISRDRKIRTAKIKTIW